MEHLIPGSVELNSPFLRFDNNFISGRLHNISGFYKGSRWKIVYHILLNYEQYTACSTSLIFQKYDII